MDKAYVLLRNATREDSNSPNIYFCKQKKTSCCIYSLTIKIILKFILLFWSGLVKNFEGLKLSSGWS